uniref:Putative secreted protein n=1 Tax=Ixodes ricinus TaxID=34613 RepID=A0A6B0UG99_IXORI
MNRCELRSGCDGAVAFCLGCFLPTLLAGDVSGAGAFNRSVNGIASRIASGGFDSRGVATSKTRPVSSENALSSSDGNLLWAFLVCSCHCHFQDLKKHEGTKHAE